MMYFIGFITLIVIYYIYKKYKFSRSDLLTFEEAIVKYHSKITPNSYMNFKTATKKFYVIREVNYKGNSYGLSIFGKDKSLYGDDYYSWYVSKDDEPTCSDIYKYKCKNGFHISWLKLNFDDYLLKFNYKGSVNIKDFDTEWGESGIFTSPYVDTESLNKDTEFAKKVVSQ